MIIYYNGKMEESSGEAGFKTFKKKIEISLELHTGGNHVGNRAGCDNPASGFRQYSGVTKGGRQQRGEIPPSASDCTG